MEKLIYKLKGKEYLLIERLITSSNTYRLKQINQQLDHLGVIEQGIKEINSGGWFSDAYGIVKLLVPVESLNAFNKLWEKD